MSDLVERVGVALRDAGAGSGWALIGQRDHYARAAIAAVLDDLADVTHDMKQAGNDEIIEVAPAEDVWSAMLTAKRKELGL